MKHLLRQSLSVIALLSMFAFIVIKPVGSVRTRSQSVASYRRLAGWTNHINLYEMGDIYGSLAITPEYTQSFRSNRIARSLFGNILNTSTTSNQGCNKKCDGASFNVSGSQQDAGFTRGAHDILADYAGLPTDFNSTVSVSPKIQNFLVDFNLFLGLDPWMCGLWFNIQAPVVWARWKLNLCETIHNKGDNNYLPGYFGPTLVDRDDLNVSFTSYLTGSVPNLGTVVKFQPLNQSMLCNSTNVTSGDCGTCSSSCNRSKTRLSDIRMALGWNFWQDEDYHVGVGIVVAAPTGTRIKDKCLFNPQIGNGHHWEVGGRFTSHYTFWNSCDYNQSFGFYFDVDVTHMFATRQCRVFDLCGHGDMSRYMLAEVLGTPVTNGLGGGIPQVLATSQFKDLFIPVANLAQSTVKVSVPVQVDLTAMLNYTHCGFAFDLGYNFWLTSCERIKQCGDKLFQGNNSYALKGTASVYGFTNEENPVPIALSATNDAATICAGTVENPNGGIVGLNAGIDNEQPAFSGGTIIDSIPNGNQIATSIQPIFIIPAEVDYVGARNKGLSHTIFAHFSYTWDQHDCIIPFIGVGGKAEFATGGKCDSSCTSTTGCTNSSDCSRTGFTHSCGDNGCNDSCLNSAISEWGIWLKGGISF